MGREEEIRVIAYRIWEEEGRGHGHKVDQWLRAEAIWEARYKPKTASEALQTTPENRAVSVTEPETAPKPKARPTTRRMATRRTIKKPPETGDNPAAE